MRFQCQVFFLQVALASAAAGSVDVSYDSGVSANTNRDLKLLGTDPDVDIFYDGTTAQCSPGTGRRLDAEKTNDPACQDPDHSWEIKYTLDIGEVIITSCPKDKVLKITGPNDGTVPTEADCDFLHNTASDIVNRPQFKNKLSLEAQTVKGAELLCDWPAGLSMNHEVNFSDEWDYQRNVTILFDSPGSNVIWSKPAEDFMYDEYYQSLCFVLEDKYVMDVGDRMAAKLSLDPPCAGESDMNVGGPNMGDMTCQPVPQDASLLVVNWANGNCFGRCGEGCPAYPGAPAQFTNDCMDYDFCTRFMADRIGSPSDCHDEFLRTMDDTMWSGNCDIDTRMEEEPEDCTVAPTPAPVPDPNPPPQLSLRPVAVTYVRGGSCADACDAISGNWECTTESLSEQNYRFGTDRITTEALVGLGVPCSNVLPVGGTDAPTDARYTISSGLCVPTMDPRDVGTFACDAATDNDNIRFCTCYVAS